MHRKSKMRDRSKIRRDLKFETRNHTGKRVPLAEDRRAKTVNELLARAETIQIVIVVTHGFGRGLPCYLLLVILIAA